MRASNRPACFQTAVRDAEARIADFKANITAQVQQLSQQAQDFFASIQVSGGSGRGSSVGVLSK